MAFSVAQKTLERLEWPVIVERLADAVRTPRGRARLQSADPTGKPGATLFESEASGVRERLAETREAATILEAGDAAPLGGAAELAPILERTRKGGALVPDELVAVGSTLAALHETAGFLRRRAPEAPLLSARAEAITPHAVLRAEIETSLDESGNVRDEASAALAEARRDAHRLAGEIQQRVERMLHRPEVQQHLSDAYFTVRNDRYVLPVRADSRSGVRGIVHDASRSGTTLFVEPEALVEPNNRHKQAELAVDQETRRVLRELSSAVTDAADDIDAGLDALAGIDLAFARARLSIDLRCVEPEVGSAGVIVLPQARHPLLPPDEAVPNDLRLGEGFTVLVLSGPNAGGKTVAMKCLALAALFVRAGLFVPAEAPARVDLFDAVLADIGDEQDIREHLSTFSAHMSNLARIVDRADGRSLVVLDEVGVGTDPGEGAAIAQSVLEALADAGARIVTTTHYNLLKEMAEVDERFANASVEFDPETLAPTYRLNTGLPGASSASAVAARMGLRSSVLERADALLSREDRRLDAMLRELATNRATLEHEQQQAARLRAETEAVRNEYGLKLERLQDKRDALYRSMRQDLDQAFKEAHERVAGVVRELQRGGVSAQEAARAREELLALERSAREAERDSGVEPAAPRLLAVDWNRARPGDPVVLAGGGKASLVALPDRRGQVAVRLGSARVMLPAERVGAPAPGDTAAVRPKQARTPARELPEGGIRALRPAGIAGRRGPRPTRRGARRSRLCRARTSRDRPRHRNGRSAARSSGAPGRLSLRGSQARCDTGRGRRRCDPGGPALRGAGIGARLAPFSVAVMGKLVLRTLLWLLLGCTIILGAFAALAGVSLGVGTWYAGGELNRTQISVWTAILRGVALQGLVPHLLLTGASWVLVARKRPSLDGRWLSLSLGLAALATLWFPFVGRFFFIVWSPGSWIDYANTLWLMAGGVTVALLLARRLAARRIGPGIFFQEPTPVS